MSVFSLLDQPLYVLLSHLDAGDVSAVELTSAYLENMEKASSLNAYVLPLRETALKQAQEEDHKRAKNTQGPLSGIPLAVKDMFCIKGTRTTACSRMLEHFVAPYDSTVTKKIRESGCIFLGKTNCDEFAMGSTNEYSAFGSVINPWLGPNGEQLVPGGSSGGSAVAVAADLCAGALGTDTGGSVRQPASYTGSVGFKPTYGRCSRFGMIAFASSLDQAGLLTKSVKDIPLLMRVISGVDARDSTTLAHQTISVFSQEHWKLISKEFKVGVLPEDFVKKLVDKTTYQHYHNAISALSKESEIIPVSLPCLDYALPTYYILSSAEASSNLSRYDGVRYGLRAEKEGDSLIEMVKRTRSQGFGEEVKRRIIAGAYVLSSGYRDAYYERAQKVREVMTLELKKCFQSVDVLVMPTSPTSAFPLSTKHTPLENYASDILTTPASLAGLPALSVPVSCKEGELPMGLQVMGDHLREDHVLAAGCFIERLFPRKKLTKRWWEETSS